MEITSWYQRFIRNYAVVAALLQDCVTIENMTKLTMSVQTLVAFDESTTCFRTAPVLSAPDFHKHFYIRRDASKEDVEGVLFQMDENNNENPVAYMSPNTNRA